MKGLKPAKIGLHFYLVVFFCVEQTDIRDTE